MSEHLTPAQEDGAEVDGEDNSLTPNTGDPEAENNTEGQTNDQPAKEEGDEPEGTEPEAEEKSPSKLRRERRKAQTEKYRQEAAKERERRQELEAKMAQFEEAAKSNLPPKEADFQDYNEYLMATAAWQAGNQFDQRQKAEIQREVQASNERAQQLQAQAKAEARENWEAQATEAKARYADFDAVVSAPDVMITNEMAQIIATSDVGADVAYHLGTNKALAAQIASLDPIEQAREIGRLEASISTPKPRTQSNAPEPISTVKAKATATKDPEKMSPAEYRKWRGTGA
ncbi:hypothetical protein OU789_10850 [Halocynthiibacter sp. C4]|uniref:hypothetical protein n=1 Tax=Halocynthiibacter sp. C4 TaxID=2992758 RepID=UPI00237C2106|nr:hypothetical protein [Halocynthiibacter sp. C4]MDE0590425.1 hypothetical protein [Halocynthiibacter sp. C4]